MREYGFHERVGARKIFIDGGGNIKEAWYFWDFERECPIPITAQAITCDLVGIQITKRESTKGGTVEKMELTIKAGEEEFIVVSGLTTWFVKSLIPRLLKLNKKQITERITLKAQKGSDENSNVVFASIGDYTDKWIKIDREVDFNAKERYENEDNLVLDIQTVQKNINMATEEMLMNTSFEKTVNKYGSVVTQSKTTQPKKTVDRPPEVDTIDDDLPF